MTTTRNALPRVLMVSDVYFPRVNGVSTSIRSFRSDLEKAGCGSILIAPRYPSFWDDEPGVVRVASHRVPCDAEDRFMRPGAALEAVGRVPGQFDVVHIQTPFVAHKVGVEVAARLNLPVVETYHTYFEQYLHHYMKWAPRRPLQWLARAVSRRQCNAVARVVSPSAEMEAVLRGYGVTAPIDVIPTGLDLRDFATGEGAKFRRRHSIAADRPVMLHVGRVAFEKNLGFILDVLERVRREVEDVLLVMAGEGPALAALRRRVASRGLDGHVLFVGYLDRRNALVDCYRAANVLVFASNTETQGLVPLEAMAAGTPVVSTAVLGTRAIVGPGRGAVCVREDAGEFAAAVARVLDDPDMQRALGREARAYVAERWSSAAMAARLIDVYEALRAPEIASSSAASLRMPPRSRRSGRERLKASR